MGMGKRIEEGLYGNGYVCTVRTLKVKEVLFDEIIEWIMLSYVQLMTLSCGWGFFWV